MSNSLVDGSFFSVPGSMGVSLVTDGINALVEFAKTREDAKTQRALMMAKKEVELATIDAKTKIDIANIQRAIANDMEYHARRMEIIHCITALITENATRLTPEMMNAAQLLLQVYQAIGNGA